MRATTNTRSVAAEETAGGRGRRAILEATAAILADEGMPGLNVTAVMRRAGISRTAFYRQFDDVYEVVSAILEATGGALLEASGEWFRGSIGSPEVIHGNLLSFARVFERHGPMLESISVAASFDADIRTLWDQLVDGFCQATEEAIRRDQEAGAIDTALDAGQAAEALTFMGEQTSIRLMGHRQAGTPDDYADLLTPIWTRTLFGIEPG